MIRTDLEMGGQVSAVGYFARMPLSNAPPGRVLKLSTTPNQQTNARTLAYVRVPCRRGWVGGPESCRFHNRGTTIPDGFSCVPRQDTSAPDFHNLNRPGFSGGSTT